MKDRGSRKRHLGVLGVKVQFLVLVYLPLGMFREAVYYIIERPVYEFLIWKFISDVATLSVAEPFFETTGSGLSRRDFQVRSL